MPKKKTTVDATAEPEEKAIEIKSAKLKDDFCNYGYEVKTGPTAGDIVPNRNGASIVHDDMKAMFQKLRVHLAVKCEEIDVEDVGDISKLEEIDFTEEQVPGSTQDRVAHFYVSKSQLDGNGEKEGVVLSGEKRLSTGEYMPMSTPKILWNGEYAFIQELRVVVDDCIMEVELYMNGKTAPKLVQAEMEFETENEDSE